MLEVQLQVLHR